MLSRFLHWLTRWFGHYYVSTYCLHGNHAACRKTCKECAAMCKCRCHVLPVEVDEDGAPRVIHLGPAESAGLP